MMISKSHHFFLLSPSPWPFLISVNCFTMFFSALIFFKTSYDYCFLSSLLLLFSCTMSWWIYYSGEFNLEGFDSNNLEKGLKFSMVLFISSEVFFFVSFFWAYFHFFLAPCLDIGMVWPPFSLQTFDCLNVPLINTLILMSSGLTVTLSHHYLTQGLKSKSNSFLFMTVLLGLLFSALQLMEYNTSFFGISDSTFGTSFFMLTGFHGIHVLIGTLFLSTVLYLQSKINSSKSGCLSFELASWYWHFVDVIWIFLYFIIYYLNN